MSDDGLRVLAIEPFYGGSHAQFLDDWSEHSRHDWTLWTLPDRHWKWRMRQSAVHFADLFQAADQTWDIIVASDMLNIAEFRGLASTAGRLPLVLYFHENQLTYPVRNDRERDLHYHLTNITSALAADEIWFNSQFHRRAFTGAIDPLLAQFPGPRLTDVSRRIVERSRVEWPGVSGGGGPPQRDEGPLHIAWAGRWEHDKNPSAFFAAIAELGQRRPFRLSVLGQSFANSPPCFAEAREQFVDAIEHWGFVESRRDYLQVLATADVFVSTAVHEFFGLSAVEAMMHCSVVLLPDRLSYPELLGPLAARYTYGGSSREGEEIDRLVARLSELAQLKRGGRWHCGHAELSRRAGVFQVERRAAEMDARLDEVVKRFSSRLPGGDGASG